MDKPGLVDWLLLPLKWLERSRGWRRRGLVLVYLGLFVVASAIAWRELHLLRLPNIREPFDEVKYGTVVVADADNAIPLYLKAGSLLTTQPRELRFFDPRKVSFHEWASLDPLFQRWVEENRPALSTWLQATERTDALMMQPNEMRITSILKPIHDIRELAIPALAEGSRRLEAGDLAGAWVYYRGVLRSSRHAGRHGNVIQRLVGERVLSVARSSVDRWIDHPATTPEMLRQAIRDVEVCRAMTPPLSESFHVEYFEVNDALDHPEMWKQYGVEPPDLESTWYLNLPGAAWTQRFLLNEPERSHRVHRLVTAGLLAQVDRPRWARPKFHSTKDSIYEIDARTPWPVSSITAESLTNWADRSAFAYLAQPYHGYITRMEVEPGQFDNFRLQMALRLHELEKGQPARTYGELLGAFLKELPEGLEPGDVVSPR